MPDTTDATADTNENTGGFEVDKEGYTDLSSSRLNEVDTDSSLSDWSGFEADSNIDNQVDKLLGNGATSYSKVTWNPFSSDKILGLPLYSNDLADPNGRVFNETLLQDIPNISIIPGEPKLNKKLVNAYGGKLSISGFLRRLAVNEQNPDAFFGFGARGIANSDDIRYIGFKPAYSTYFKYVQNMLSALYSFLDVDKDYIFRFSDEFKNSIHDYGLSFYADRATSISEDANNSYGTSKIAEMVGEKSATARESEMFLGKDTFGDRATRAVQSLKAWNPKALLESLFSYDSALTLTANSLFRVVNGSQLAFPDVWQDSKFDRSYNISFKFYSPYGDKLAIFRYVYVPFIALLALCLPKQDGILGYAQPFFIRLNAPGWFTIDLGVVNSLTISKGGSDMLWTVDGLPQMIEVNMSVTDLYPSLTISKSDSMLKYTRDMKRYLENMAGIRPDELSFLKVKAAIERKISNSVLFNNALYGEEFKNSIESWAYEMQSKISNIF